MRHTGRKKQHFATKPAGSRMIQTGSQSGGVKGHEEGSTCVCGSFYLPLQTAAALPSSSCVFICFIYMYFCQKTNQIWCSGGKYCVLDAKEERSRCAKSSFFRTGLVKWCKFKRDFRFFSLLLLTAKKQTMNLVKISKMICAVDCAKVGGVAQFLLHS